MALFSVFTGMVLASKKAWTASLVLVLTQLPMLLLFHRQAPPHARRHSSRLSPASLPPPCLPLPAAAPPPPASRPALPSGRRRVSLEVGHYATVLPLQATLAAPRAQVDPAVYTPPPLRPQAVGWYPEWGKVWEKYGVSRYSW
jgi:hypothetical protein